MSRAISPRLEHEFPEVFVRQVWGRRLLDPENLKRMNIAMGSRDFQTKHAFPGDKEEMYHVNLVPFLDSINHGYDLAQENRDYCFSCDMRFPKSEPPYWACTTYCDLPKGTPLMFPYAMHGHHPCAQEGIRNYGFYDHENWLPCGTAGEEADEDSMEGARPATSEEFEARHLRKDIYDIAERVSARWFNRELGIFADDGGFYEGLITGDNGDGTYAVGFMDGDNAERVEVEDIRVVLVASPTWESESD